MLSQIYTHISDISMLFSRSSYLKFLKESLGAFLGYPRHLRSSGIQS